MRYAIWRDTVVSVEAKVKLDEMETAMRKLHVCTEEAQEVIRPYLGKHTAADDVAAIVDDMQAYLNVGDD